MSRWTHISAVIRLDALRLGWDDNRLYKERVTEIIGPMCTYEEWREDSRLPRGSEGGLEYKLVVTGAENDLAWASLVIWGDLRDYDSYEDIEAWWAGLMVAFGEHDAPPRDLPKDDPVVVNWRYTPLARQAICTIMIESRNDAIVLTETGRRMPDGEVVYEQENTEA